MKKRATEVTTLCCSAAVQFGVEVDQEEIARFVESLLMQPRDLLAAERKGIVTKAEVAKGVVDRFERLLIEKSQRDWGEIGTPDMWQELVRGIEKVL